MKIALFDAWYFTGIVQCSINANLFYRYPRKNECSIPRKRHSRKWQSQHSDLWNYRSRSRIVQGSRATISDPGFRERLISGLFQMPNLLGDRLHEFTKLALITQLILIAMPLYHVAIGAVPMDSMWYLLVIVSAGFLYFTYALGKDA